MKKTIKSDKLITIMTEFEIEQSKAWHRQKTLESHKNELGLASWAEERYAAGIGYCLKELEELLK